MKKNKAIFLDRDGVLNRAIVKNNKPYSPLSIKDFKFLPNVRKTIKFLSPKYIIIVVSNQPEVERGNLSLHVLEMMNNKIYKKLNVHDILNCIHDDNAKCNCRKPKIGMLIKAKNKWNIDFKSSYLVGDRWKDIEAGQKAKCKTIYLDRNYDEKRPTNFDFKIKTINDMLKIIP